MSLVSLVMATLGRVREIEEFVQSLAAQTHKDYELIIVDQNPDDRLIPVINFARDLGIPVIHLRQSLPNQCLARNAGLSHAQGNFVAFPDDDCWYENDVLEKVVKRMHEGDSPECVVIRWLEQDPVGGKPHRISNKLWRRFKEVKCSCITLFFKRNLLLELEGFDAAFGLHSWYGGSEETDLMFRVIANDSNVVYLPDALVHHPFNRSINRPFLKEFAQARSRARGTGAIYAKHKLEVLVILRGFLSPLIKPWFTTKSILRIIQSLCLSLGRIEGFLHWRFSEQRADKY